MEVISSEISTRNTISFNVNFDSLLEKYQEQGQYKLFYKQNFTISLEYGTNYPGYIIIFHLIDRNLFHDPDILSDYGFTLIMENEEMKNSNLIVDFQLTINEEIHNCGSKGWEAASYFDFTDHPDYRDHPYGYGISHYFENVDQFFKFKSMKGKMIFKFETKFSLHKEFRLNLGLNLTAPCGKEDFTIICKDQKIKFEKQLLINISPVFRGMLESPWSVESRNGHVEIKEVKPGTILAFKNLLLNGNAFKKEDLNIDMMIFADRYIIKELFDLCVKYIDSFDVTNENIFESIQVLCLNNKDSFLEKAVLLLKKNYGALKQDPRWEEFTKKNPICVLKMLELSVEK